VDLPGAGPPVGLVTDLVGDDAAVYPALPYPGQRPPHPYLQVGRRVLELRRGADRSWSVGGQHLDGWLASVGAVPLAGRVPLLCYGSNACPSKLVDLRGRCGLTGPVVMTPCRVTGLAAAWCAGERHVDQSVPATLAPANGSEAHLLWWVAPDQWAALDRCEGRRGRPGDRYSLRRLRPGHVVDDLGRDVPGVRAYVGVASHRLPMTDAAGRPLLVRDLDQAGARAALASSGGAVRRTA
jgi:hypothetical protein